MKISYLLLTLCLLSIPAQSVVVSGKNNPDITFENQEKYLLGHVIESQLDQSSKFSATSVIRKKENTFVHQGDILSLTENDFEDIGDGNWVYTSFYNLQKTRLSKGTYEAVGALILGTTETQDAQHLHFAALGKIVNDNKTAVSETAKTNKSSKITKKQKMKSKQKKLVYQKNNRKITITFFKK